MDMDAAFGFLFIVWIIIMIMLCFKILFAKHRGRGFKTSILDRFKPKTEEQPKKIRLPSLIVKKVKVCVLYPERHVEVFGRITEDGNEIKTKIGSFIVPPDYKPKYTWANRKCYLTYYFDANGNAVTVNVDGKAEVEAPDPRFSRALIDKGLMAKIFRLGFDWSSLITGIFLGTFLMTFMLFIVLPMVGIPIHIGEQAVKIIRETSPVIPGPGNYTIPIP